MDLVYGLDRVRHEASRTTLGFLPSSLSATPVVVSKVTIAVQYDGGTVG